MKYLLSLLTIAPLLAEDIMIADFEGSDYAGWTVEGEAFGKAPSARLRDLGQKGVFAYFGDTVANSYAGKTGSLTSEPFTIERDHLQFYIAGGTDAKTLGIELHVDGEVVHSAASKNSDNILRPYSWDVSALKGKQAKVRIFDSSDKKGGEIMVDQIYQTNDPVKEEDRSASFTIDNQYFHVPLSSSPVARQYYLEIKVDGELLGSFKAPLAIGEPDFYGMFDLRHMQGKSLDLDVRSFPKELEHYSFDAEIKGEAPLYEETRRPQLHFTSRRGWLNDPNGLIYHDGVYHMYYQYNPLGIMWGNMSWGHAVSKDLVHWEERPAVLYPTPEGGLVYSGANFMDKKNQLGLKTGENDVMVAFYLRTKLGLSFAYSNDNGETYTDYEGNPVLTHAGARIDTPRPVWYEPTQRWVAPTYDFYRDENGEKKRCVGFYSSADLKEWRFESRVEQDAWGDELCGCVDFFQLPIDGDEDNKKWVMIFIEGSYIIGDFDGKTFTTLEGKPAHTDDRITDLVIDRNYYATMTWHDAPAGRRVQTTWMKGGGFENMPFSQQMSLLSELTLHSTPEGPRLKIYPIEELKTLRKGATVLKDVELTKDSDPLADVALDVFDMEVVLEPGENSITQFDLRGEKLTYDAAKESLTVAIHRQSSAHVPLIDGKLHLRLVMDRGSFEIYANKGTDYICKAARPALDNLDLRIWCPEGTAKAASIEVHKMGSIWDQAKK